MSTAEVIESYIDDIVRLLPRRQQDDVAAELRSLLNEELHARAQVSGHPSDEPLALLLVRSYGARTRWRLAIIRSGPSLTPPTPGVS
jgi:hypothetical protein